MVRAVGKHDSRNSMKMKRRKSQVKKKARLKRQSKERKAAPGQGAKKPAARKKRAAAPPTSRPPADDADGHGSRPPARSRPSLSGSRADSSGQRRGSGRRRVVPSETALGRDRPSAVPRTRPARRAGRRRRRPLLVDELPAVLVVPALLERRDAELLLFGAVPRHPDEDVDVVLAVRAACPRAHVRDADGSCPSRGGAPRTRRARPARRGPSRSPCVRSERRG